MNPEEQTSEAPVTPAEDFDYLPYSYLNDPVYKHIVKVAISIGMLGFLANGFVIVVMLRYVKMQSHTSTMLVVNQAVVDGMCSFIVMITYILLATMDGRLEGWWGDMLCLVIISESLIFFGYITSTFSLV